MRVISHLNSRLLLPFQMILDIGQQLSDDLYRDLKSSVFEDYFEVKTANDWINLEAFGNMTAVRAQALIQILNQYFRANQIEQIYIDLYLNDKTLTSDNLYSLLILADEIRPLNVNLCVIAQSPINESCLKYFSDKDNLLLTHIKENEINRKCATENIAHVLKKNRFSVLSGKGYSFKETSNDDHPESPKLVDDSIRYAWSILKLGAYDIATNLLAHVLIQKELPKTSYEHILMHLQLIRFHAHQYEAVALQDYPEFNHLEERSVQYIQYIKAYSATLSRHADIAGKCFEACGVHQDMSILDEFNLYQLNIFALFNVIRGQIDTAYQLEMKIESAIKSNPHASLGLKYVNNINIARLYKKLEQYELSRQYYEQAYDELSGGGYTTSDYIYYNMNLGSLYEAQTKAQDALVCWVKAAMHWLVSKNPYSLAWRPKIILTQERSVDLNFPLSLKSVASFFVDKIRALLDLSQIPLRHGESFSFKLNQARIHEAHAYIQDHFIVYGSLSEGESPHLDMSTLRALLSDVIREMLPIAPSVKSILIDYQSESLLRKQKEFWALALVHDCEEWIINQESLKPQQIRALSAFQNILLKPSRLIQTVVSDGKGIRLMYQRSFMNKFIQDEATIEVFRTLLDKPLKLKPNMQLPEKWVQMLFEHLLEFEY
ncbi:MAG: hypothetical protein U1E78_04055 [Gammaproteobacteria bacterium]